MGVTEDLRDLRRQLAALRDRVQRLADRARTEVAELRDRDDQMTAAGQSLAARVTAIEARLDAAQIP